ncbi:MAG: hypothetical protein Q9159_000536 [Coniocarpon cinnabarinum]
MATAALSTVRRALLYVPASSSKFLDKSRTLPPLDNITYDLEDSVTPSNKPAAREALRAFLRSGKPGNAREIAVRINSVDSGFALDDLQEVLQAPGVDALVVPKVNAASDLHFVTDAIRHLAPLRHPSTSPSSLENSQQHDSANEQRKRPLELLALVESARSLTDLTSICAASPCLNGLIFAAEDFALDLSLTRTPSLSEFLFARSSIVTAARAFNLPSAIDLVCTSFRGETGLTTLREESENGRRLGFNGKQVIHPSQVEIVENVFGVSEEEATWAVRVLIADEKAEAQGRGAWTLDGKMIDKPVVGKASGLVERAKACGFEVGTLRERFKDQEPE